jgi:glutamate synthase domain-containing protein 2
MRRVFVEEGLARRVALIGTGKLGFPEAALTAFALGRDLVNVGREPLMAIGCIQAQRCHTNHCPTGIATQNRSLSRGLDPQLKSVRLANYVNTLRKELLALSRACGAAHPAHVNASQLEMLDSHFGAQTLEVLFGGRRAPIATPQAAHSRRSVA